MQWSREVDEGGVSSRTYPEQEDGIFSDGCVCVSERDGGDRERVKQTGKEKESERVCKRTMETERGREAGLGYIGALTCSAEMVY